MLFNYRGLENVLIAVSAKLIINCQLTRLPFYDVQPPGLQAQRSGARFVLKLRLGAVNAPIWCISFLVFFSLSYQRCTARFDLPY